jgi:hypothetical protein
MLAHKIRERAGKPRLAICSVKLARRLKWILGSATNVPAPRRRSTSPSCSSSASACRAVIKLTSWLRASSLSEGTASPGCSSPASMRFRSAY